MSASRRERAAYIDRSVFELPCQQLYCFWFGRSFQRCCAWLFFFCFFVLAIVPPFDIKCCVNIFTKIRSHLCVCLCFLFQIDKSTYRQSRELWMRAHAYGSRKKYSMYLFYYWIEITHIYDSICTFVFRIHHVQPSSNRSIEIFCS